MPVLFSIVTFAVSWRLLAESFGRQKTVRAARRTNDGGLAAPSQCASLSPSFTLKRQTRPVLSVPPSAEPRYCRMTPGTPQTCSSAWPDISVYFTESSISVGEPEALFENSVSASRESEMC